MEEKRAYWVAVDHSVVIDSEGHVVDGLTRVELEVTDEVKKAEKKKQLVLIPDDAYLEPVRPDPNEGEGSNGDTVPPSGEGEPDAGKMGTDKQKASTKSSSKKEK